MKKITTLALVGILCSCNFSDLELDKIEGPSLSNAFAVNIGSVSYTVGDLVKDLGNESLKIEEGDDLFLSLVYRDTSRFSDLNDFAVLDDVINTESYSPIPTDIPAQPIEHTLVVPQKEFEFEIVAEDGKKVDSVYFNGGTLEYTLTSDFGSKIDYVFELRDVRHPDDQPVVFNETMEANETTDNQSIPLDGLKNVATRVGDKNTFKVTLDMTMTIPAGTEIRSSDKIGIILSFINPEFSAVFGNFDGDPIEILKDTIEIAAFEELNEGGLSLRNPSINIEMDNAFGIELGISFDDVQAIKSDGTVIALEGDAVTNLQFIDAPNSSQLGEVVTSSFSIDITNSNIDELLNSTPSKMVFGVSASSNPIGSDNPNNFILDSSYVEIRTVMEIPFDFKMDGFSKDFDFSSPDGIDGADSLVLNIRTINQIPISGAISISFKDEIGDEIYQLSNITVIDSPETDAEGKSIGSKENIASIILSHEGIDAFLTSSDIVATISIFSFKSSEGNFVKIFSDYKLEVYLSAAGKINIDL
jgi:hypothetical protein